MIVEHAREAPLPQPAPAAAARHADEVMDWLRDLGYTHCFFVAGGNIMHFLNAARTRFTCVPVVHEVAGGIAAEYFNAVDPVGRAFALVTAGPGLTNIVTAMAGAYLESRELLVIGGQVKSEDLASGGLRQRGIQEIDGELIVRPVCVYSRRVTSPISHEEFDAAVECGRTGRKGPVFLEFCLDAQGAPAIGSAPSTEPPLPALPQSRTAIRPGAALGSLDRVADLIRRSKRPMFLLGGGIDRAVAREVRDDLIRIGIPVQTTWNGIDRIGANETVYAGRPNTWGQRSANVLIQQADLVIALGTRLGLQQTGFNWQKFVPVGKLVQVDLDVTELSKGHPHVDVAVAGDANELLRGLTRGSYPDFTEWLGFCMYVREKLPLDDPANSMREGYVNPFRFYADLSRFATRDDILIPCSSGGANSTALQTIEQKRGQLIVTDKGLASMGYGLSGAIGAALAWPQRRTIVVEGDGGFVQNLQELGTVAVNALDIKIFIFSNEGYASIRSTQRNYFGGAYVGCDTRTGLGFPDWIKLFEAYGIPVASAGPEAFESEWFAAEMNARGARAFIVPIDPEQVYLPRIASRMTALGNMESDPLHLMTPQLAPDVARDVMRYLPQEARA